MASQVAHQRIVSTADIKRLGTILSVWAHPDDESYLAAGIMATAVVQGQQVICVTATKGEAGSQDEVKWPPATLGEVRATELAAALKELGITQHHWLGYGDGRCAAVPSAEAVAQLKSLIERYHPDTILTFGPEGMTGHPDHATVSRWVDQAVEGLAEPPVIYHAVHTPEQYEQIKPADQKLNIFYNIDAPPLIEPAQCDIHFELPTAAMDAKHRALAAMPSQTEAMLRFFDRTFLDKAFSIEAFRRAPTA
ncbi:MAG TPA: PIG-L family deacetylase [Candidatus Saccharimonadales bacterium]|nr:PIG-L family deacetylase [Candidatus Saccharimonadales bacterium]